MASAPSVAFPLEAEPLKDFPDLAMVRYRIDVGLQTGATPKHIVGAIANEAGIEFRYIGRIDMYDDFSTVDLPDGMPRDLLEHLKKVRFGQVRFNMEPVAAAAPRKRTPRREGEGPPRRDGEGPPRRHK